MIRGSAASDVITPGEPPLTLAFGRPEGHGVGQVEGFGTELKPESLADGESARQRDIEILEPGTAQRIAGRISESDDR